MGKFTLILGGARSGKSAFAENLAAQSGGDVTYLATAEAHDEEMQARITHHRANRPANWYTREIPFGIGKSLMATPPATSIILLDCVTLLISNLVINATDKNSMVNEAIAVNAVEKEIDDLIDAVHTLSADWIVVSNEVGLGLVPPYPLGRVYRDLLGRANQRLAQQANQVIFMIAGIPMALSPLS